MSVRREAALRAVQSRPIPISERVIVALDVATVAEAERIVDELGSSINFYKIGMQLQFAEGGHPSRSGSGLEFAKRLAGEGKKVFLDSKLLDIEQTISNAVENIAKMGVTFLTVHGMGKTVEAAVHGRGNSNLKILAVTVLTSLDQFDLNELGITIAVEEMVLKQTKKALEAGADGVIASGQEAGRIRELFHHQPIVVTPGIRPSGSPANDQRRIVTPSQAIRDGADYLVIGRPILAAPEKRKAAEKILEEIEQAVAQTASAAAS